MPLPYNENLTEALAFATVTLCPANRTAAAYNTVAVQMRLFRRLLYILDCGVITSGGTADFKLQASLDSAFSTPIDITGAVITQITAGATNLATIELKAESLGNLGLSADSWIRAVLTIGTAAIYTAVICLGDVTRYSPASDYNATLTQQVVV